MTTLHNGLSDIKLSYLYRFVKEGKVLDVGAGNCKYAAWMKLMVPELEITAVDHVFADVDSSIKFECLDLENSLPFEDQSFEVVIAFDILEHINHIDDLLKELYRVLKPGGIIVGSVPHDNDKFLPAYNLTFYHRSDVTHKRYYTPESLTSVLQKHHFDQTKTWLEGGVSPAVIAEFFPKAFQFLVKKMVGLGRRIRLIKTDVLKSDLFFVAYKQK